MGDRLDTIFMQLDKIVRCHGSHVEALSPDVDRSRSRQDLEDPDGAGRGGPGITEDRLVFAVDQGSMRGIRLESKYGSRLVERLFDSTTAA